MKQKIQISDISILLTIASTTLYVVFRNLGREVGSFAFLWAPITIMVIIYSRPITFTKGPIKNLLLYGLIMVGILQYSLWSYMNDWNQIRIFNEFYFLVIMVVILNYYLVRGDIKKLAWLSKWAFIFIIISLITTNIALYFDPLVVRESANTVDFTPNQEKIYNLTGAMSYSYLQSIVCLIPILVYHIKNKKRMVFLPIVLVVILLLLLITLIRAQVFANVLIAILITTLSFLGSKRQRTSGIIISIFFILFMAIPTSFYSDMLYSLSSKFNPNSEMYYKLTDLASFIENPEIDTYTGAGGRASRYPLLLEALIANPVFGDASYNSSFDIDVGAHLYWMNRLALWGIFGFLFYIFMLYKIYRSISSLFDANYRFYYVLSVMAFILLGLMKTLGGREPFLILIVVIPGLYFLPLLQQKNDVAH
jgi:hypothetical protein